MVTTGFPLHGARLLRRVTVAGVMLVALGGLGVAVGVIGTAPAPNLAPVAASGHQSHPANLVGSYGGHGNGGSQGSGSNQGYGTQGGCPSSWGWSNTYQSMPCATTTSVTPTTAATSTTISTPTSTPVPTSTTTTAPQVVTKATSAALTTTSTSVVPAVVSAQSSSLAFTGPGRGVTTIFLVGLAVTILGLAVLVVVDGPRRLVRRLAVLHPRGRPGWGSSVDGSASRGASADSPAGLWLRAPARHETTARAFRPRHRRR